MKLLTVVELILWVIEEVCDNYCKYPEQYLRKYKNEDEAIERLCSERCEKCPLNKLH